MNKFDYMEKFNYEQMTFFQDKATGLKAVTTIHNTVLGPALGGTRFWVYNNEEDAVEDSLRLARGMTYKNSMAGLPIGGGKTVVIGDVKELRKNSVKTEAFWRTFGRYVEGMGGRYITAADVGTTTEDMALINMETENVVGLPGRSGDPSPYTALGILKALAASCNHVFGSDSFEGKTFAIEGLGKVGYALCEQLHKSGAKLIVTDIDEEKVKQAVANFKAVRVEVKDIRSVECDIYAPCALGASVNDETIPQFKCKIICGAANNVLKDAAVHGSALLKKGIVYAPDYVVNAGGVINVSHELVPGGYKEDASIRDINRIYGRVLEILQTAKETGKPTHEVADKMAEDRIEAIKNTKGILVR